MTKKTKTKKPAKKVAEKKMPKDMAAFAESVLGQLRPVRATLKRHFFDQTVRAKELEPLQKYPVGCVSVHYSDGVPKVEISCPNTHVALHLMNVLNLRLAWTHDKKGFKFSDDYLKSYGGTETEDIRGIKVKDAKGK